MLLREVLEQLVDDKINLDTAESYIEDIIYDAQRDAVEDTLASW